MRAAAGILGLLLAAAVQTHAGPQVDAAALVGEWWTPGFGARVRIEACGDAVCGHIVWVWDESPQDIVDKRPLVGRKVIEGMRADGGARWTGGRLYNPEDGRDYKGFVQLQSASRLLVEGCVLFVCRQQTWRRADPLRCPPVAPPT